MSVARAVFDGKVFIPLTPVKVKKDQEVFVTIIDDQKDNCANKPYLRYAGALSQEDFNEITEILKDTEIVYADEW